MGFFVDKRKVFRVEVHTPPDPDTGEQTTAWVDLRKMTEGDIQDRQDIATEIRTAQRRQQGKQFKGHLKKGGKRRGQPQQTEDASMRYALGALRGFDLVRSIVDWDLRDDKGRRVPPTPDNIAALDPFTATEIHNEIALINPTIFPTGDNEQVPQDLEYDEDTDLDYDEDEPAPQNEDDEIYGADEDAPPEAGGVGSRDTGDVEDLEDEEEEESPTRQTSGSRR